MGAEVLKKGNLIGQGNSRGEASGPDQKQIIMVKITKRRLPLKQ